MEFNAFVLPHFWLFFTPFNTFIILRCNFSDVVRGSHRSIFRLSIWRFIVRIHIKCFSFSRVKHYLLRNYCLYILNFGCLFFRRSVRRLWPLQGLGESFYWFSNIWLNLSSRRRSSKLMPQYFVGCNRFIIVSSVHLVNNFNKFKKSFCSRLNAFQIQYFCPSLFGKFDSLLLHLTRVYFLQSPYEVLIGVSE